MLKEEIKQSPVETPLMKQYYGIKAKYPDALLLFRVGDFYETFSEDAVRASAILGIILTRRANGSGTFIELAGFPHHSLDTYLPRLVRAGMRVAICDQLEDPKLTKKIVKRGVTELVSPGVSYSDKILEHKKNNFLAAIHSDGKTTGIAFIDISTGEFLIAEGDSVYADKLLQNFSPCEIIYSKLKKKEYGEQLSPRFYSFPLDEWIFQEDYAKETLLKHFGMVSLKGFGIDEMSLGIIAAGAALHYVSDTRQDQLKHISGISRIEEDKYVWLDKFTIRNLEIVSPSGENGVSLIEVIDYTQTPMGGRLLKRWLLLPLKDVRAIEERQEAVYFMLQKNDFSAGLSAHLKQVGDIERLISKAALGKISPREVQQLRRSLEMVQLIREVCLDADNDAIRAIGDQLNNCSLIKDRIIRELHPDAPVMVNKGGVINDGFNQELDELRNIAFNGKDYLLKLQQREENEQALLP